jgi:uncharacterized protein YdhG (YjbR/CyaY superfamily)
MTLAMTKPKNFDEYIVAFPAETQNILKQLRETIQFPHHKPLPLELITKIVKFRVNKNLEKLKIG